MQTVEIWKPIKGYEDQYRISSEGRVENIRTKRIWNGYKVRNGYLKISLCRNQEEKSRFVHDIVAETFLDKPDDCTEIDHIDRNPANNSVSNLRWVTHKENTRNCKSNKLLTIDGVTKTLSEWAEMSEIDYHTIKNRIKRGWNPKEAVFHPLTKKRVVNTEYVRKPNYNSTLYEFNGEKHTIPEWAKILDLNKHTLCSRLHMGWSIEEILTKPIKKKARNKNVRRKER